MENEFLHHTCAQLNGGKPIQVPPTFVSASRQVPSFERAQSQNQGMGVPMQIPQGLMSELHREVQRLRNENTEIRYSKELQDRNFENAMWENQTLYSKLENLENVFIGSRLPKPSEGKSEDSKSQLSYDYTTSTLMLENQELKRKLLITENEKYDLKMALQQYQSQY